MVRLDHEKGSYFVEVHGQQIDLETNMFSDFSGHKINYINKGIFCLCFCFKINDNDFYCYA